MLVLFYLKANSIQEVKKTSVQYDTSESIFWIHISGLNSKTQYIGIGQNLKVKIQVKKQAFPHSLEAPPFAAGSVGWASAVSSDLSPFLPA